MSSITLYPSNWLYNAGVIGLSTVLEGVGENVKVLLSNDGSLSLDKMKISAILSSQTANHVTEPLNAMPAWHWNYAKMSFEWKYGSIGNFVADVLQRAQRTTNRSQLRDQLKCKNFDYGDRGVDFSNVNQHIHDVWEKTFGRGATLTIERAKAEIRRAIREKEDAYIYRKAIGSLFSKGGFYENLFNPSWFGDLKKFIDFFTSSRVFMSSSSESRCAFCSTGHYEVEAINITQMSFLFPAFGGFPNAYWQNDEKQATYICRLCKFLTIHHHLAFTRLSDGSEIFVNAPSFKVMYHLNKFVREVFGALSSEEMRTKRELLAMSVIEYATRMRATVGLWVGMNLEIVSRKGGDIEFFSLPYDVVQLISDRDIAAQLSEIGEFKILNLVLKQEYSKLPELGYRLLRESLSDPNKRNEEFINYWLYLPRNKGSKLGQTAEKIFRLYALIEQKQQRSASYGYANNATA